MVFCFLLPETNALLPETNALRPGRPARARGLHHAHCLLRDHQLRECLPFVLKSIGQLGDPPLEFLHLDAVRAGDPLAGR